MSTWSEVDIQDEMDRVSAHMDALRACAEALAAGRTLTQSGLDKANEFVRLAGVRREWERLLEERQDAQARDQAQDQAQDGQEGSA